MSNCRLEFIMHVYWCWEFDKSLKLDKGMIMSVQGKQLSPIVRSLLGETKKNHEGTTTI